MKLATILRSSKKIILDYKNQYNVIEAVPYYIVIIILWIRDVFFFVLNNIRIKILITYLL